jgi:hypothetical protein
MNRANLSGADLSSASLDQVSLCNGDLQNANLCLADLRGANLRSANFDGANLDRAILNGANLEAAKLNGARLIETQFRDANLCEANLTGANLSGAILYCANLHRANLQNANLNDAFIRGAILLESSLDGVNMLDAELANPGMGPWQQGKPTKVQLVNDWILSCANEEHPHIRQDDTECRMVWPDSQLRRDFSEEHWFKIIEFGDKPVISKIGSFVTRAGVVEDIIALDPEYGGEFCWINDNDERWRLDGVYGFPVATMFDFIWVPGDRSRDIVKRTRAKSLRRTGRQ